MTPARRVGALLALALTAVLALGATGGGAADAAAPNPPRDIPIGRLPAVCYRHGRGPVCEHAALHALNHARRTLHLAPYRVPPGFTKLSPGRQWLILANLDRAAYHLLPISGIASALNAIARSGAQARTDPNPWPLLQSLHGQAQIGFGSNWAGGQPNGLVAYFGWMYDDGYGGENIDCRTATAAGCWGHRRNILSFATGPVLTMGTAAIHSTTSYALTIVVTSSAPWPLSYRAPA
jgi:hypothetical protein